MELVKRIVSSVVLVAGIIAILFWGKIPTMIFAAVICVLMMLDVTNALKHGGFKPNRIVLIITAALACPMLLFQGLNGYFFLAVVAFAVIATCVILSKNPDFKSILGGGFALIYPLMPACLLVALTVADVNRDDRFGTSLIIGTLLCACLSDTSAYFFGKFLGKKKLCPQISPKKTVVGSVASFFGGAVGGTLAFFFLNYTNQYIPIYHWLIMGFLCGGFSQIGDLTASMLKRYCDIKDFGRYIPGHGGIMDRMDSISVCLIAVVTYVQIFIVEFL